MPLSDWKQWNLRVLKCYRVNLPNHATKSWGKVHKGRHIYFKTYLN